MSSKDSPAFRYVASKYDSVGSGLEKGLEDGLCFGEDGESCASD